jgi:D-glycerate 3-kinase
MKLDDFLSAHGLPEHYAESARQHYLRFADWLYDRIRGSDRNTFVLGINGAQGTGKSTCADLIKEYLAAEHDVASVVLSIDDIYQTRRERHELALTVHPLLETRGVPGTHDVALGLRALEELQSLGPGMTMQIPRFDKSIDDRLPEIEWPLVTGPVDLVIFEGWCVASQPSDPAELVQPVNSLEREEDTHAAWRTYVNERLGAEYKELFATLDALLFLKAPNFDVVYEWRLEQEHKLRATASDTARAIMSDDDVARFIQFYERITRNNLDVLPDVANAVIELDTDHRAVSTSFRG